MFPTWAKNILFLLVYMISGLILVIIIEDLLSGTQLLPLNRAIESAIMGLRTPLITSFMVGVTQIGNPFIFSVLTAILAIYLVLKGKWYDAALLLSAFFIAVVSVTILKNISQVTRPVAPIYQAEGWSFPSGHATLATTFFFLLAHLFYDKIRSTQGKVALALGSIVAALLVAISRIYLGAHWTLDTLAGVSLGVLCVSFTVLMFNIFLSKRRSFKNLLQ